MNFQIHFPQKILCDRNLTAQQLNILMYLYLYRNIDGVVRLTSKKIVEDLDITKQQNVSRVLKPLIGKYIEMVKNPTNKTQLWYKLIIDNKIDFVQLDSKIYKLYMNKSELVTEYFRYKYTYALLLAENSVNGINVNIFNHCRIGLYEYDYFCKIHKLLFDKGLIDLTNNYVDFPEEKDSKRQFKTFVEYYKMRKKEEK